MKITLEFTRASDAGDPYGFRFEAQHYIRRLASGERESASFPWSQELLEALAALREPGVDPELVQRLGDVLQEFVRATGWRAEEQRINEALARGEEVIVDLRSTAAELYLLPWELLTLRGSGRHLGALNDTLVRYGWPGSRCTPPRDPARDDEGGVLLVWSAAGGLIPTTEHVEAVARATTRGRARFDPRSTDEGGDVLVNASLERLAEVLEQAARGERRRVDMLHVLCHVNNVYSLGFDVAGGDDPKEVDAIDPARLRQLLAKHADQIRAVVLCACDSGGAGAPGDHLGSVAQNLHRAGIELVIASRLPLSIRGSIVFTRALYDALLVQLRSLERAFVHARQELTRVHAGTLDWASMQLYAHADRGDDTRPLIIRPYRGLLPFTEKHSRFFHGREAECSEILGDLRALEEAGAPRLLVVAGASGTGKSSVVHAGAVPELVGDDDLREPEEAAVDVETLRRTAVLQVESLVRATGDEGFGRALAELRRPASASRQSRGAWDIRTIRPGAAPVETLEACLRERADSRRDLLLIVDQFEELFTQTAEPSARERFARRLWTLAGARASGRRVYCLLTIRVDFLGHCGQLVLDEDGTRLDRVAYDERHRVFVAQMGPEQLLRAIETPAQQVGLQLQEGLARRILADVGEEPGALPLLQYTLDRLWQERRGRVLELASYEAMGGLVGALERRAEELVEQLDPIERRQARRLFTNLVAVSDDQVSDTRRPAELAALRELDPAEGAAAAFDRVVERFVDARLLVRGEQGGEAVVEVAHEAILRKWKRLRVWLSEDRDKLAALRELESWLAPWRKHGSLLEGNQLAFATRVRGRHPHDITRDVAELIDTSAAAAEALERRKRRNVQLIVAASVATVALMAVLSAVIYRWYLDSMDLQAAHKLASEQAERARVDALDSLYLGTARLLTEDPTRAAAWLREVKHPGELRGWISLANHALQQPVASTVLTPGASEISAHVGTRRLLTRSNSRGFANIAQQDRAGEKVARVWPLPGLEPDDRLRLSDDGERVLILPREGDRVTSVLIGEERRVHAAAVVPQSARVHPDGARVLLRARDEPNQMVLWDSRTGARIRRFTASAEVQDARFLDEGARVLIRDAREYSLWSVDDLSAAPRRIPGRPCAGGERVVVTVDADPRTALVFQLNASADGPARQISHSRPVTSCAVLDGAPDHVVIRRAELLQLRSLELARGYTRDLVGVPSTRGESTLLVGAHLVHSGVHRSRVDGPDSRRFALHDLSKNTRKDELLETPDELREFECHEAPFAIADADPSTSNDGAAIACNGPDALTMWRVGERPTRVERYRGALISRREAPLDLVLRDGFYAELRSSAAGEEDPGVRVHAGSALKSVTFPRGDAGVITSSAAAIRMWGDPMTQRLARRLSSRCPVRALEFSRSEPGQLWINTGCMNEPATRWDIGGDARPVSAYATRLSPAGDWMLALDVDGGASILRADGATVPLQDVEALKLNAGNTIGDWAISPDGQFIAIAGYAWASADGQAVVKAAGGWGPVLSERALVQIEDDALVLRRLIGGTAAPQVLAADRRGLEDITISRDGSRLLARRGDDYLIWSLDGAKPSAPRTLARQGTSAPRLSSDGRWLLADGATDSAPSQLVTWRARLDGADGAPVLEPQRSRALAIKRVSGEADVIAVVDSSGLQLRVAPLADEARGGGRLTDTARFDAVLFSETTERFATHAENGLLRVWEPDGSLIESFHYAHRPARWSFNADGSQLAVWAPAEPQVVRVFELDVGRLERALWDATTLCPSVEARMKYLGGARVDAITAQSLCRSRVGRLVDPYQQTREIREAGERAAQTENRGAEARPPIREE